MNYTEIKEYYRTNEIELNNFFKEMENTINGRICHTSVILLKIISDLCIINNYLEIGVHNGGSISMIINNKNIKKIYGIDLFEDIYIPNKHLNNDKYELYQYFKRDNISIDKTIDNLKKINNEKEIILIKGNSYFDETENKLKNAIEEPIDLIHLDGDHTFEGIKNDFNRYFKYLKKDKFLVFDDYHHNDIKKFVENLKEKEDIKLIGSFKFHHTAEQFLIQKIK